MLAVGRIGSLGSVMGQGGGGGPGPSFALSYLNAFAADVCNFPFYGQATTPPGVYYADLDATVLVWEAYVGSGREVHLRYRFHDTANAVAPALEGPAKRTSKTYFVGNNSLLADDHGVPSQRRGVDKYLRVWAGAHESAQHWYQSNNAINALSDFDAGFTEQTPYDSVLTYPHVYDVTGKLFHFSRDGTDDNDNYLILYAATPVAGLWTPGSKRTMIDLGVNTRCYQGNGIKVGTKIVQSLTKANADDTLRANTYICVYDTVADAYSNKDGTFTVASASLPVLLTDLNAHFIAVDTTGDTGNTPAIWRAGAANDELHLLFMDNNTPGSTTYSVYHKMCKPTLFGGDGSDWGTITHVCDMDHGAVTHRYDGFAGNRTADGGSDIVSTAASSTVSSARGGDQIRIHRSPAGVFSSPIRFTASAAVGRPLDATTMIEDAHPAWNIAFSELHYIANLGTGGDEDGTTCIYAIGNDPASPFVAAGPYGPDEAAYVAKMAGAPTAAVRQALKNLIDFYRGTKDVTSGLTLWQLTRQIYPFLAADATTALLNLRQPRFDLTQNGSPAFVGAYQGFTGVANGYWDLGLNLGGNYGGTNFRVNGAVKNNATTQSLVGTASGNDITLFWDGTTLTCKLGDSGTAMAPAFSATAGVVGITRTGTAEKAFGNGVALANKTATNANFQVNHIFINRRTTLYSLATHYFWEFGIYADDASEILIQSAIKAFVNAVGSGISI